MANRVILLACGSFNPPTYYHLRMFEIARDYLQLVHHCIVLEGIMSPVADNFQKKKIALAPAEHRLNMAELAAAASRWIRADGWECKREVWSRTVEVLRHHNQELRNKYSNEKLPRLLLLCGGDLVDTFTRRDESDPSRRLWRQEHLKEILTDYGLVIVHRSNAHPKQTLHSDDLDFLRENMDNVIYVPQDNTFPNEISSTLIRQAIHQGNSIRYCTEHAVVNYIEQHELYTAEWEQKREKEIDCKIVEHQSITSQTNNKVD